MLVFLLIIVGIIWFLITPVFKNITLNSNDFLKQKTELAKTQSEIDNFKDFDESYDTYLTQISRMEKLIFDQVLIEGDLSLDLIEFLKTEALKQGIDIKVTPQSVGDSGLEIFKISTFRLNLTGTTTKCFNFISRIEHSRWLSEIDSMTITKTTEDINVSFVLKVYAKNQPKI